MSIPTDSRYNFTDVIMVVDAKGSPQENTRVDLPYQRPRVTLENVPDLVNYPVRGGDTWRGLSARAFRGRTDLWWAIAEFSGVIDPFTEMSVGRTTPNAKGLLRVPTMETTMFDVLSFRR